MSFSTNADPSPAPPLLIPQPRHLQPGDGVLRLLPEGELRLAPRGGIECPPELIELYRGLLTPLGVDWKLTLADPPEPGRTGLEVIIDRGLVPRPEQYRLTIDPLRITIQAGDTAGAQHGAMTLRQLIRRAAAMPRSGDAPAQLPCLRIDDWPDFPNRGVMLDVSRDKSPTLETLRGLIDLFAELKYNQLQLYTEHAFAYRNYADVWGEASPLTASEILELDDYCRRRHIELVPNQNSFGHMERWLRVPRLNSLAETPGQPMPLSKSFSICPLDPGSLALLEELYAELLPHFRSRLFNVGCDETFELGQGRSREACERDGKGRVYLDFLLKIYRLARREGRTMMFWGDIIMQHPELIPDLPRDVIALEWGYEADHPFAEDARRFAAAGIPFYVCPGTSSWNALLGRTDNALVNLASAARHGREQGAIGYLNTDWGDYGHWQYLPVSYLGFAWGAAQAWSGDRNDASSLPAALDAHVFFDAAGVMGRVVHDLGNIYRQIGVVRANQSLACTALYWPERPLPDEELSRLDANALKTLAARVDQMLSPLAGARLARPDGELIAAELRNAAALARHGLEQLAARAATGTPLIRNLPANRRAELAAGLRPLVEEHRRLWSARNRAGGLRESCERFGYVLREYEA